ncbi:PTS IIA-like nitrogen-regulatory protein PtsN [Colwellia chukchiensis]|uniref:PTS IIA-like nitrogen-regulatory protein PtsN n=1 Tax=Colwellia chukchiensis TaxID=641665 RepID=A0A1H7LGP8_9GAMM|nr:PTS IIA-like nitrogen regulatory protein PtsN [Colwellia chukchiensis]SEK98066.1 PTS IIA-like nitrogen-regulatory protein PtsN [Colwellia chukchiensis]
MKLQDILTPDCTICAVPGASKKRILEYLSSLAANKLQNQDTYSLLESLVKRERMGSTGIGNGIAIPHGRVAGATKPVAVVITTEQAINFDAIDHRHVDIFIALFVPEDECQNHLVTLQNIAKIFRDKQFCKQVRKCQSDQALFQLIQQAS